MADEPQQAPPSNNSRITAMLQDLAAQRAAGAVPAPVRPQISPPTRPQQPAPTAPVGAPPVNLPVTPPQRPVPPATPTPAAPRPVMPAPAEPKAPAIAPIPQPMSPPPAPKEPPVAPMPAVPRPPQPAPVTAAPKPVAPPIIPPPVAPSPAGQKEGYSAELRTMSADIGNIKVGQSPSGIRQVTPSAPAAPMASAPSAPSAPVIAPKAPSAPAIVVPSTSGGSSRKFVYLVIGAVVLIGITYVLVSMIGGSGPGATPTPSASESSSPVPTLGSKTLRSYFGYPKATISLTASASSSDFVNKTMDAIQPQGGLASPITVTIDNSDQGVLGVLRLSGDISIANALTQIAGTDQMIMVYGQKEHFNSSGAADTTKPVSPAYIFVLEVKDASAATQFIGTLPSIDPRSGCTDFNNGAYRQIQIQYRNCPFADNSEDYAVLLAGNQKNYLIISESRESMFFAIDQLMQ